MPDEAAPQGVEALIAAADDAAPAEARGDGMAVVRFWAELNAAGIPEDLAADLTRTWLESYLDGSPCGPDCD
jgi:hypothetical protein